MTNGKQRIVTATCTDTSLLRLSLMEQLLHGSLGVIGLLTNRLEIGLEFGLYWDEFHGRL